MDMDMVSHGISHGVSHGTCMARCSAMLSEGPNSRLGLGLGLGQGRAAVLRFLGDLRPGGKGQPRKHVVLAPGGLQGTDYASVELAPGSGAGFALCSGHGRLRHRARAAMGACGGAVLRLRPVARLGGGP
jgi:hypothetical protein